MIDRDRLIEKEVDREVGESEKNKRRERKKRRRTKIKGETEC